MAALDRNNSGAEDLGKECRGLDRKCDGGRKVGRHLDVDQDRQGEKEPEELYEWGCGSKELDHEPRRPGKPPPRRQTRQREDQTQRHTEGERRDSDRQCPEKPLPQQVRIRQNSGEIPFVHPVFALPRGSEAFAHDRGNRCRIEAEIAQELFVPLLRLAGLVVAVDLFIHPIEERRVILFPNRH